MAGRRGRPTKRSVAAIRAITGALAAGNTRTNAARLGGIDYATLKRWCRLSAPFCAALETAEAEAIAAEIGKPELVDAIERDILISVEAQR
jgi:hypothetical protein